MCTIRDGKVEGKRKEVSHWYHRCLFLRGRISFSSDALALSFPSVPLEICNFPGTTVVACHASHERVNVAPEILPRLPTFRARYTPARWILQDAHTGQPFFTVVFSMQHVARVDFNFFKENIGGHDYISDTRTCTVTEYMRAPGITHLFACISATGVCTSVSRINFEGKGIYEGFVSVVFRRNRWIECNNGTKVHFCFRGLAIFSEIVFCRSCDSVFNSKTNWRVKMTHLWFLLFRIIKKMTDGFLRNYWTNWFSNTKSEL